MTVVLPTKAQAELLAWLIEWEDTHPAREFRGSRGWTGGDLIKFYRERAVGANRARAEKRGVEMAAWESEPRGGYANHGWRRAGGTALKNLQQKGYVTLSFSGTSIPTYTLTPLARTALKQYTIEPGQVRRVPFGWMLVKEPVEDRTGWWWVVPGNAFPDNIRREQWSGSEIRAHEVYEPPDGDWRQTFHQWPWHGDYRPEVYDN